MSDDHAGSRTAEWFSPYVLAVAKREEEAGGPIPGTPSLRDMQFLYVAFQSMENCGDSMSATDLHALMELLSDVRDAWVDPETDEIGKTLFPILDEMHAALGQSLDEAMPEAAANRQKVEDLRALQRSIRRRVAQHVPGPVERLTNWFGGKLKRQASEDSKK